VAGQYQGANLVCGVDEAVLKLLRPDAIIGLLLVQNLAIVYAGTGEKDLALQQLEDLLPNYGLLSYGQLRLHPFWDPLRRDPRFEKLVEESKKPVALK